MRGAISRCRKRRMEVSISDVGRRMQEREFGNISLWLESGWRNLRAEMKDRKYEGITHVSILQGAIDLVELGELSGEKK